MTARHRTARHLLAVIMIAAGVAWSFAANARDLAVGASVERVLRVDGKQVALPGGSWIVAADAPSDWNDPKIGAFGYLRTVVLFQVVDSRVAAILEVNTNVLPTTDGWGMAAECARTDLVLAVVRYRAGWDGSCYFVTHTLLAKEPTPAWRKARDFAVMKGWRVSRVWLTAGLRTADRSDVLDIRFHFGPETRGIPSETIDRWQDSAWMPARLDNDAQRYGFVRAVSDGAVSYSSLADAGLKNRLLGDDAISMPHTIDRGATADVIMRRLAELELMRQAGTITPEEYTAQATALKEHGLRTSSEAPDLGVITAVKAISYRIIVSISHIFVDY